MTHIIIVYNFRALYICLFCWKAKIYLWFSENFEHWIGRNIGLQGHILLDFSPNL